MTISFEKLETTDPIVVTAGLGSCFATLEFGVRGITGAAADCRDQSWPVWCQHAAFDVNQISLAKIAASRSLQS